MDTVRLYAQYRTQMKNVWQEQIAELITTKFGTGRSRFRRAEDATGIPSYRLRRIVNRGAYGVSPHLINSALALLQAAEPNRDDGR